MKVQQNNKEVYRVYPYDLPLCCPLPGKMPWDAHPRVYLPITFEKEIECPYCSQRFKLKTMT